MYQAIYYSLAVTVSNSNLQTIKQTFAKRVKSITKSKLYINENGKRNHFT